MSGFIVFPRAIEPGSAALTFGISLRVLNGDALSKWEFDQLYSPEERKHFDGKALRDELEYFARVIWFPIKKLRVKLTLPARASTPPFLSAFRCTASEKILKSQVVTPGGVLEIFPSKKSGWHPSDLKTRCRWERIEDPLLAERGSIELLNSAPYTWELTVQEPRVGSCYSLDWVLHSSPALDNLASRAADLRKHLLDHRGSGQKQFEKSDHIHSHFMDLKKQIYSIFRPGKQERLEVSVMTYDQSQRALVYFDGAVGENGLPDANWRTHIPFGLGLAGSSFKEAKIFVYLNESRPIGASETYIPLPGTEPHEFLVSLPLDHPEFADSSEEVLLDRSRQCIGVLNIGSWNRQRRLQANQVPKLSAACREFCERLYDTLMIR